MSYDIRLDAEFGAENSSYSTAIVAEDDQRSIHWGHASHRGETRPIVTLKLGFLTITVDEAKIGKPRMRALQKAYDWRNREKVAATRIASTPENRRDAAHAAALADNFELAGQLDPVVLFDGIAVDTLAVFAEHMDVGRLMGLLNATRLELQRTAEDAHRSGVDDAKAELRQWLGIGNGVPRCCHDGLP